MIHSSAPDFIAETALIEVSRAQREALAKIDRWWAALMVAGVSADEANWIADDIAEEMNIEARRVG